jgi:Putative DNA-binding domain
MSTAAATRSGGLQAFQRDFAAALGGDETAASGMPPPFARQPGFAVYRNTVRLACIDALQANYPTVARLVGDAWFRDAAGLFVATHLPRDAVLARYGNGFAEFLAAFEPARTLAYLPGVARLDRCWTEAHLAADAPALTASALAASSAQVLAAKRLVPHPAARWLHFPDLPAYTIWRRHREALRLDDELPWVGERALLTRPGDTVGWQAIGAAAFAFLGASAQGDSFALAVQTAAAAEPDADLAAWLPALVSAGAFMNNATTTT